MKLKNSLILAVVLSVLAIALWESYWRAKGYYPTIDDNSPLWAVQRAKVKNLDSMDVILLGSSRVLFDIQLDQWEEVTGNKPLQLASAGATPLPAFRDLVENTEFKGTVIVGVTPGLFFSTTSTLASPWKQIQDRVDYFENRTYAQKSNHFLSLPLQKNFSFISDVEGVDGINLKQLLKKIELGNRTGPGMPPFHEFSDISVDRNTKMTSRTVTDTAFANTIKTNWQFFEKDAKPPEKEATIAYFLQDATKFKARGGNLILLRCPSTGYYEKIEAKFFPRKEYWEELLRQTGARGYHYMDHEELNHFDCPEWSHLSAPDAALFTKELAKIMLNDGVISNSKSN